MNEIIPNLWLGDRDDAVRIGDDPEWVIFNIVENPLFETPHEPKTSINFSILEHCDDPHHGIKGFGPCSCRAKEEIAIVKNMDKAALAISKALFDDKKKVLVHCVRGMERSVLEVVWFLYRCTGFADSLEGAYDIVEAKRPEIERRLYWLPKKYHYHPYRRNFLTRRFRK